MKNLQISNAVSILICAFTILACADRPGQQEQQTLANQHAGLYAGLIPCPDCEGIDFRLRLGEDLRYNLSLLYREKSAERKISEGRFQFLSPDRIRLDNEVPKTWRNYRLTDSGIMILDRDGSEMQGTAAGKYKLLKMKKLQQD